MSIKLGDENIKPNAKFQASPTWSQDLEITVRNDSEEPISFMEVEVAVYNMAQRTTELSATYKFGKREGSTDRLAPGDSAVLTFRGETGDPTVPGVNGAAGGPDIRVMPREVIWNGDASVKWHGGHTVYRDPNNPGKYLKAQPSGARYQFPKGHKQDAKLNQNQHLTLKRNLCAISVRTPHHLFAYPCRNAKSGLRNVRSLVTPNCHETSNSGNRVTGNSRNPGNFGNYRGCVGLKIIGSPPDPHVTVFTTATN